MAIDDLPSKRALQQLEMEDIEKTALARLPAVVSKVVAAFLSCDPTQVADLVTQFHDNRETQRSMFLLRWVIKDLETLLGKVDKLTEQQDEYMRTDWLVLYLDADKKARATRAEARIKRLADILCASIVLAPIPPADQTEEMMRIATELTDEDVIVLKVDVHFGKLLEWINRSGFTPSFRILKTIDRGCYGWSELVTHEPCSSSSEVERFYERLGGYLAVSYGLKATDMHFDNLIAVGEFPVPVAVNPLEFAELFPYYGLRNLPLLRLPQNFMQISPNKADPSKSVVDGSGVRTGVDVPVRKPGKAEVYPSPFESVSDIGSEILHDPV